MQLPSVVSSPPSMLLEGYDPSFESVVDLPARRQQLADDLTPSFVARLLFLSFKDDHRAGRAEREEQACLTRNGARNVSPRTSRYYHSSIVGDEGQSDPS